MRAFLYEGFIYVGSIERGIYRVMIPSPEMSYSERDLGTLPVERMDMLAQPVKDFYGIKL